MGLNPMILRQGRAFAFQSVLQSIQPSLAAPTARAVSFKGPAADDCWAYNHRLQRADSCPPGGVEERQDLRLKLSSGLTGLKSQLPRAIKLKYSRLTHMCTASAAGFANRLPGTL